MARRGGCSAVSLCLLLTLPGAALAGCNLLVDTGGLSSSGEGPGSAEAGREEAGDAGALDATAEVDAPTTVDGGPDAEVPVLARDRFERLVQDGFGAAEVGGTWSLGGAPNLFSVAGGRGTITIASAGTGPYAGLAQVVTDDAEVDVTVSSNKLGGGSGLYISILVRKVGSSEYYGMLHIDEQGGVRAELKREETEEVTLAATSDFTVVAPNEPLRVRVQATGRSPTTLRLKVWRAEAPEPSSWTCQASDSTPSLQTKGSVGLNSYLSSTATNAPLAVSFDELLVRPASLLP